MGGVVLRSGFGRVSPRSLARGGAWRVLFLVAMVVLVAVGVLLWKAVSAQALATGNATTEDETATRPTRRPNSGPKPGRPRPVAPDDDPEFLRRLDEELRRDDGPSGGTGTAT